MTGQMQGEDRLRPTVLVAAARIDPVAAAAAGQIGQDCTAIVGAEKPPPRRIAMRNPEGVLGEPMRGPGALNGGLRLQRLLVEGQYFAIATQTVGPDRAEESLAAGLEFR